MTPRAILTRRSFLASLPALPAIAAGAAPPIEVGLNTSSLAHQRNAADPAERLAREDIPAFAAGELGITTLDLETGALGPRDPRAAERFRARAAAAGCRVINLKVNFHDLPFDSEDAPARARALAEYRAWIEIAALLGATSLRPYPSAARPRFATLAESYAHLADHGARHGVRLLIENYKWIESDPQAIPGLIRHLGGRIGALVDTGNWADAPTRRAGLAAAFPLAVTCDFKFRELAPDGTHPSYDLREAFAIGRRAGYRGPWCFEHTHRSRRELVRELRFMKSQLESWSRA